MFKTQANDSLPSAETNGEFDQFASLNEQSQPVQLTLQKVIKNVSRYTAPLFKEFRATLEELEIEKTISWTFDEAKQKFFNILLNCVTKRFSDDFDGDDLISIQEFFAVFFNFIYCDSPRKELLDLINALRKIRSLSCTNVQKNKPEIFDFNFEHNNVKLLFDFVKLVLTVPNILHTVVPVPLITIKSAAMKTIKGKDLAVYDSDAFQTSTAMIFAQCETIKSFKYFKTTPYTSTAIQALLSENIPNFSKVKCFDTTVGALKDSIIYDPYNCTIVANPTSVLFCIIDCINLYKKDDDCYNSKAYPKLLNVNKHANIAFFVKSENGAENLDENTECI